MKNKNNVYVEVESKEQAEIFRRVLEAMGEKISFDYYPYDKRTKKLAFSEGWYLSREEWKSRSCLTFGELIDLLQRKPLLISEDGVELFKGSKYYQAVLSLGKWELNIWESGNPWTLEADDNVVLTPEENKTFSTKQAALEWIESQKPKYKTVKTYFGLEARIMDNSEIHIYKENDFYIKLSYGDIHDIKSFLTD